MSIIGAAAPYRGDNSISPPADALPASKIPSPASSGRHHRRDPATRIDLSDKVKSILARAGSDQNVASRLKAFVAAHRIDTKDASTQDTSSSDQGSSTDINQAFEQLSGGSQPADGSQDLDGSFQIAGESAGFSSFGADVAVQAYRRGSQEYVTFSKSEIAATSVTASSAAGAVSATSTGTHTESLTFAVDFRTGAVSLSQSESTSVSTAVRIVQPTSPFSTSA